MDLRCGARHTRVTMTPLDHPARVKPGYHIFVDRRMPWLKMADGLPQCIGWGPHRCRAGLPSSASRSGRGILQDTAQTPAKGGQSLPGVVMLGT